MSAPLRKSFLVEPTVSTSAYADGDAIAGLQTMTEALRVGALSGKVASLSVLDLAQQSAPLEIYFYETAVTGGTDNAAYAPSDADLAKCLGVVKVVAADYNNTSAQSVATLKPELSLQLGEGGGDLFLQIVSGGTPTYADTDELKLRVVIEQD